MNDYTLFAAGAAMAAALVILLRMSGESSRFGSRRTQMNHPGRKVFTTGEGEVFQPKALALIFDESGPGISVNGMFHNQEEGVEVDLVSAGVNAGGRAIEMENEEAPDVDEQDALRLADMVNLGGPAWLDEGRSGMFRAPLRSPEMEEAMDDILAAIGDEAEKMVERMDRDRPGGYSLDEESMKRPLDGFLASYGVRSLLDEMERLFIWRPGHVSMTVWFLDPEDGIIDEIPISFELGEEDSAALRGNIRLMAANALLTALNLDPAEYHTAVLESGEGGR